MEDEEIREILELGNIMLQPITYRIIKSLKREPHNLTELSEILKLDNNVVSFHLSVLMQWGFVDGNYQVLIAPNVKERAGKWYTTTPKVDMVKSKLCELLNNGFFYG